MKIIIWCGTLCGKKWPLQSWLTNRNLFYAMYGILALCVKCNAIIIIIIILHATSLNEES